MRAVALTFRRSAWCTLTRNPFADSLAAAEVQITDLTVVETAEPPDGARLSHLTAAGVMSEGRATISRFAIDSGRQAGVRVQGVGQVQLYDGRISDSPLAIDVEDTPQDLRRLLNRLQLQNNNLDLEVD